MNLINQVNDTNYDQLIETVLDKAYDMTHTDKDQVINIILVSNKTIQDLNKTYRDKDAVTDVLTFPADLDDELGDVFISLDKAKQQAEDFGHSITREIAFLTIHGFLHALGYDHQTETEKDQMFNLQNSILDALKIKR
jgi:probable rRNA maturation factor